MKRILIVDDDGDMRAIYRYMLGGEAAGYDLRFARDGLQALRMLARKPADLVISDVIMKSMDGMTFVRRLREGGFSAPVLVVSVLKREMLPGARGAKRVYFMEKPVTPHGLRGALRRILAAGR